MRKHLQSQTQLKLPLRFSPKSKLQSHVAHRLAQWLAVPLLLAALPWTITGCDEYEEACPQINERYWQDMKGEVAHAEFSILSFRLEGHDQEPVEVCINGLPVEDVWGADKVSADQVEVVRRRGVRFSHILDRAEIEADDDLPVNCIARDRWDPLRTQLQGDTSKLSTFGFLRDWGYVYVGSPGDKDPLYPTMEGRSLIVDYDLESDAQVPQELGGLLSSIGRFRWMMVEKVSATEFGLFEIDPVP